MMTEMRKPPPRATPMIHSTLPAFTPGFWYSNSPSWYTRLPTVTWNNTHNDGTSGQHVYNGMSWQHVNNGNVMAICKQWVCHGNMCIIGMSWQDEYNGNVITTY